VNYMVTDSVSYVGVKLPSGAKELKLANKMRHLRPTGTVSLRGCRSTALRLASKNLGDFASVLI
jgi:hypothetical protein